MGTIRRSRGFSMVELIIVIAVISALAAMAVVGVSRHRMDAEDARVQANLSSIYKAMAAFRGIYGRYPRDKAELGQFFPIPSDFDLRYQINPNG